MADLHKNFAYSTVATAPSSATAGTSLVVAAADGAKFPTPPFNATVWPASSQPTATNAEIVRVTAISTDTFTITRKQEGSNVRSIAVGDQIAATITAKTLTDAESPLTSFSPYVVNSGAHTGVQTLISASSQTGTASLFVFPVTVPGNIQFNQILLPVSLSYITSAVASTISASHYSYFGLYSMTGSTALSLISSNSFSIGETHGSVSLTWNFPTTTMTTGYGYGSFPAGNLTTSAQISSYVSGTRGIGLQFGGNMNLTPDIYYLGLLYLRSSGNTNTYGLSHAGVIGHVMNPLNNIGSVSGPIPIGSAASQFSTMAANSSGWWGRHLVAFMSATSITNQAGTAIPSAITLSALGAVAAASTATIIPWVSFVST
jgi:hypothetical protein